MAHKGNTDPSMSLLEFDLLAFDGVEEMDLVGPWEIVGLLCDRGYAKKPRMVTLDEPQVVGEHGMKLVADAAFDEVQPAPIVVIPGGSGARRVAKNPSVRRFVQDLVSAQSTLLSVCTGSLLLQSAGVLKGRRATTHWNFLERLHQDPSIEIEESRFVNDGRLWTSAGISAGLDMMLAYIERVLGEPVASQIQLDAEYFPSSRVYEGFGDVSSLPAYIRRYD